MDLISSAIDLRKCLETIGFWTTSDCVIPSKYPKQSDTKFTAMSCDYLVSEFVSLHGPSIHDLMFAFVFPVKQRGACRLCLDYQHRVQFVALILQHCTVVSVET